MNIGFSKTCYLTSSESAALPLPVQWPKWNNSLVLPKPGYKQMLKLPLVMHNSENATSTLCPVMQWPKRSKLSFHQVGVSLARLNKTGSSFGEQEQNLRVWILHLLQVWQKQLLWFL